MSVYFARVGQYVKVGYSENPERRVRRLFASETRYGAPTDCPTGLAHRELLATLPGDTGPESVAHAALDDFRVVGEFFVDEPQVRDYLARCVRAGQVLAEVVTRADGPAYVPAPDETDPAIMGSFFQAMSA